MKIKTPAPVTALISGLAMTLAAPALAEAPGQAEIPYRTLALADTVLAAIPAADRDKLEARTRIIDKKGGAPLTAVINDGGRITSLTIGAQGLVRLRPTRRGSVGPDAVVRFNRTKGSLGLESGVAILSPAGDTASAEYYRQAVRQAQGALAAGVRARASVFGLLSMPTISAITFRFTGCCGRVELIEGRTFTQDRAGLVIVPLAALTGDRVREVRIGGAPLAEITPFVR